MRYSSSKLFKNEATTSANWSKYFPAFRAGGNVYGILRVIGPYKVPLEMGDRI